ncbi:MAG: hypothetical protein MJ070_08040 [Lachnospiraceae bacterium]|nr:hypothetical protein [Lachnospiraceae bacterium]
MKEPDRPKTAELNGNTVLTYRLMKTDYADINGDRKSLRPSYSILLVESRRNDEARQKLLFDLSPEEERAARLLDTIADAGVSTEEIEELLSELL